MFLFFSVQLAIIKKKQVFIIVILLYYFYFPYNIHILNNFFGHMIARILSHLIFHYLKL